MGLNEGGGAHVKVRLRRPGRDWDFFPFEHVLDTMLHELCHIEHGPHNADFYRLWDEVREECEDLIAKGINGTAKGFDLPGRRLGGFTRYPSPPPLRQAALVAAERRARGGPVSPSGPRRLGGDGDIMTALSPIQAAAMAAERRMYDDQWCASRSSSHGESSARPNGLKGDDGYSNVMTQGGGHRPDAPPPLGSLQPPGGSASKGISASDELQWECNVCSLLNKVNFLSQHSIFDLTLLLGQCFLQLSWLISFYHFSLIIYFVLLFFFLALLRRLPNQCFILLMRG